MDSSIRIRTKVLPGHRIEIAAPQWSEGASVDVLLRLEDAPEKIIASRTELLRMSVEQRRRILIQQSEHMTAYYSSDEDRSDWQGGDIIE